MAKTPDQPPAAADIIKAGQIAFDKVTMNSHEAEVVKGTQRPSSGKVVGPANLNLLKSADRRLTKISPTPVTQVEKVRAAVGNGKKTVYIWPADDDDLEAIPVLRYKNGAWINLVTLLSPLNLTVPAGYSYRYAIKYAPEGSPVWPALMFDLGKPLEKKLVKKKKKSAEKSAAKKGATQPPTVNSQPDTEDDEA
ncbi:MAG TPA: hypothetical protein VGK74_17340 [Symbiobacteriaceae bacterium]|jgi:hypothetical protein